MFNTFIGIFHIGFNRINTIDLFNKFCEIFQPRAVNAAITHSFRERKKMKKYGILILILFQKSKIEGVEFFFEMNLNI